MHNTPVVRIVPADKVLVTFGRPSIFLGDGWSADVWDRETFVGSMTGGKLVQYETEPGKHLFMVGGEVWGYAEGNLEAGKQYFLKLNVYPGVEKRLRNPGQSAKWTLAP
jgi:hypothetical protein